MDAGPGTDLGGLGWYLGVWVTMTAAMMLPSAAPTALVVAWVFRGTPTVIFTAGYLAVWTAYGLGAYGLFRLVTSFDTGWLDWDGSGPYMAGGAIVAAGIYELTVVKERFLRSCRGPLDLVGANGRWLGPLRIGLEHGLDCVGCCFGLMLVLFALGVMSVLWMALIAARDPSPRRSCRAGSGSPAPSLRLVILLGIWMAVSPSSVPGLPEPDRPPSMQMEM